ncbi:MAG: hypothetical protein ACFFDN_20470 [Candidatus Hodarchaeota archaeon]
MKFKSWNMKAVIFRKKTFLLINLIIFSVLIFSVNFNHISYPNENQLVNESNYFPCQEFRMHQADMNYSYFNNFEVNIIFDTSHHQVWSTWDTGFIGYSDLVILLMKNSFRVSASTRFLNETILSLNNNDILVLNVGYYQTYTDQEITLIVQFVSEGGGLLILGEHENAFEVSTFQNKLLQNFNMSIYNDTIQDSTSHYQTNDQWITFNSNFFDLTNITFFAAASLNISNGVTPIAITSNYSITTDNSTPDNRIVGAYCEYEEGRVLCVTDTEFIWNADDANGGNYEFGIKVGNNSKFALKIFNYLANRSFITNSIEVKPEYNLFTANNFLLNLTTNGNYNITAEIYGGTIIPTNLTNASLLTTWEVNVSDDGFIKFIINNTGEIKNYTVYFLKPTISNMSILILEVNFSRRAEPTLSGLYNFSQYLRNHNFSVFASEFELNTSDFDAICIANPLQNFSDKQISNLLNSKKLLILGESYSSLNVNNFFNSILRLYNYSPLWNPIKSILLQYGINLTHYLICDNDSNYQNNVIYPTIQGIIPELEFFAYQSSVVTTTEPNLQVFASGKRSTSWGEGNSSLGYGTPLFFNEGDINSTSLIIYNSSIMVIGDTDVITNERGDAFLFPFLTHWLKSGNPYNIKLTSSKGRIFLDGKSEFTITSGIIYDSNGTELNNGTLITVSTDLGKIITPDEDSLTPGIQVSIKNRILTFRVQTGNVQGIAKVSAYNISLAVIGQIKIKFIYYPIPELITIFIKNQADLEKTNTFIITLIICFISIGAVSSVLIIERKIIQSKIAQLKKTMKQKGIERKKRKKREKFVREKL